MPDTRVWLRRYDSSQVSREQSQIQLRELTNLALQVQQLHLTGRNEDENFIYQVRNFFIVIFASLLSALFLTEKRPTGGLQAVGVALSLIIFLQDIHLAYDSRAYIKFINCDAKTVRELSKTEPDSSHWYYLDFDKDRVIYDPTLTCMWDSIDLNSIHKIQMNSENRERGEWHGFLTPGPEQSCFYVLPLLIFLWGGRLKKLAQRGESKAGDA
jgi:hypothetical protein